MTEVDEPLFTPETLQAAAFVGAASLFAVALIVIALLLR